MKSLDYAEDLHVLWSQYKLQMPDRKPPALETLKNIVAHCRHAMANGADNNYFLQHIGIACNAARRDHATEIE